MSLLGLQPEQARIGAALRSGEGKGGVEGSSSSGEHGPQCDGQMVPLTHPQSITGVNHDEGAIPHAPCRAPPATHCRASSMSCASGALQHQRAHHAPPARCVAASCRSRWPMCSPCPCTPKFGLAPECFAMAAQAGLLEHANTLIITRTALGQIGAPVSERTA